jgi:hypothetical protein
VTTEPELLGVEADAIEHGQDRVGPDSELTRGSV